MCISLVSKCSVAWWPVGKKSCLAVRAVEGKGQLWAEGKIKKKRNPFQSEISFPVATGYVIWSLFLHIRSAVFFLVGVSPIVMLRFRTRAVFREEFNLSYTYQFLLFVYLLLFYEYPLQTLPTERSNSNRFVCKLKPCLNLHRFRFSIFSSCLWSFAGWFLDPRLLSRWTETHSGLSLLTRCIVSWNFHAKFCCFLDMAVGSLVAHLCWTFLCSRGICIGLHRTMQVVHWLCFLNCI